MRKALIAVLALAVLVSAGAAMAAKTGQAKPWVYDESPTGSAVATWTKDGLLLEKNALLSDLVAAGADIKGVADDKLNNISFEVKGYCGAGAPRFNVYDGSSTYPAYYLGCANGDQQTLTDGWKKVTFSGDEAGGVGAIDSIMKSLDITMDEPGSTLLRNITVNGVTITK